MKPNQTIKLLIFTLIVVNFSSCAKDDISSNVDYTGITVSLKSDSSKLKDIFLEIEGIQLRVKEDSSSANAWVSLSTVNTGTYDVSKLRSESELLLVNHSEIASAFIYEIRLVLGDNNFMNIDEMLVSLDVAENGNATPSNLIELDFEANHFYDLMINIDLDASVSFNEAENMMTLNPKLFTEIRKF